MLNIQQELNRSWIELCILTDFRRESGKITEMHTSLCISSLGCFLQRVLVSTVVKEGKEELGFLWHKILNFSRVS